MVIFCALKHVYIIQHLSHPVRYLLYCSQANYIIKLTNACLFGYFLLGPEGNLCGKLVKDCSTTWMYVVMQKHSNLLSWVCLLLCGNAQRGKLLYASMHMLSGSHPVLVKV